ncbi:hypothetical protein H0H87_004567, partial [Tephrocybe sp. NHM501043]
FGARLPHTNEAEILTFAVKKLLGGSTHVFGDAQQLACLSRRLPVDFYTSHLAYHQAQKQVEGHLRVCLQVDPTFQGMVTVSPSEPLLSEAAARLMYNKSYAKLLAHVLYGFAVHKGDRGEFIGMMLAIDARDHTIYDPIVTLPSTDEQTFHQESLRVGANEDMEDVDDDHEDQTDIEGELAKQHVDTSVFWKQAPYDLVFTVPSFLRNLFSIDFSHALPSRCHPSHKGQTLSSLLATAKLNFNHFIKVHEYAAIRDPNLRRALARGAGLLCANNQPGVDLCIPFTFGDDHLQKDSTTAVLLQINNGPKITEAKMDDLFDLMDPILLGILSDKTPNPMPVIRIVLSLASSKSSIVIRQNDDSKSKFTSFDFFCSGISHNVFRHVRKEDEKLWNKLVEASSPWKQIYTPALSKGKVLRRAQNPLAATEPGFYSAYSE